MAKITKTKSGKYHASVFIGFSPDGKRIRKSITASSKREVWQEIAKAKGDEPQTFSNMTLREAYGRYINSKRNTLSPSTVSEYENAKDRDFPLLAPMKLSQLNNELIQTAVNEIAATDAPKTVRNKFYLLRPVLKAYRPDLVLNIRLPQKIKPDDYIPTQDDVHKLLEAAPPSLRVPILLGAFAGLRRSEICALTPEDFSNFTVRINKAKVKGENGFAIKPPKTHRGYRNPPLSPDIIKECLAWDHFDMSPNTLGNQFRKLRDQCNVPIRFHMLRHFYCATLIDAGLDFMTIMTYGGWESVDMVTKVYGYMMKNRKKDEKVINIYSQFKKEKAPAIS